MKTRHLLLLVLSIFVNLILAPSTSAQSVCENVSASVFRHPTVSNLLVIRFEDQSGAFVNYPSLNLLYNGDIIAEGETTLFQFPEVSYHLLEPDLLIEEGETYAFTIDVYAIFGSEYVCSFEWEGVPYEPEDCFGGLFTVSTSTNSVEQEIELVVRDEFDNIVLTQNIWVEFGNLSSTFPLCLPRACYSVTLEAVGAAFQSNYLLTWATEGQSWFSQLAGESETFVSFELDLWEGCSFVSVREPAHHVIKEAHFPTVVNAGAEVYPLSRFEQPVRLQVFSLSGAQVSERQGDSFVAPGMPGMYLVRYTTTDGKSFTQRLVVY